MRKILFILAFLLVGTPTFAQTQIGGGGSSVSPGSTAATIYQTGLIGYYQALPGETVASLKDYSTAGNNATGTTGTAPLIIAGTGGLNCNPGGVMGGVILPASLNSAATIMVAVGYQPSVAQFVSINAPVIGNGTPATSGVGIAINQGLNSLQPTVLGNAYGSTGNNGSGNLFDQAFTYIAGIGDLALVMDATQDHLYYNGVDVVAGTTGALLGKQLTGSYQLCGALTGVGQNTATNFTGQIYAILFWNVELTAQQIYQTHIALQNLLLSRGINPLPYRTDTADAIWAGGDSTTAGAGFIGWPNRVVGLNGAWNPINMGRSGATASALLSEVLVTGDSICSTAGGRTALVLLTGSNDSVAQTTFANARGILNANRLPNCSRPSTILSTMMVNGNNVAANNTYKNAVNLLIRTNCLSTADYCIDLGETVALGADGASASAVYFQGDHLHPTQAGADVLTWVTQRGINRYFGNHDVTTANVYVAPAVAAVAVSAATEAGNVMTFTTAANTFTKGMCITVAGVTPTNYNSTFANSAGLNCWYALSVSATSFTAWNQTSGLGALTVAGTAVAPQQVDADAVEILNFGAGNHTLQPCDGLTINDVTKIKNINAVASTVVPFGAQTIDGAASVTVASKATLILQPVLVSPVAGGCNWLQLQNN